MANPTKAEPWKPEQGISPDDVARPVVGIAWDYASGDYIPRHHHRKAQLVFASEGVMTVSTDEGSWVVPPQRAVWVPGATQHEIAMSGPVKMRTLYLSPEAAARFPDHCAVVSVSALLRELIVRAVGFGPAYSDDGPEMRLVDVLLDEIFATQTAPLHLPLSDEPRTRRVMDALLASPGDARDLEAWSKVAGASARTVARLFERETGMTFGAWRTQLRLLRSLESLALGNDVTTVALSLGYESPSAFIAMFRRQLGETPGRYFDTPGGARRGAD